MASQDLPRVSHYGTIRIGDLSFDCAVLDDQEHTRVYIQNQLNNALSVSFGRGSQGRGFLAKFAPKYLENISKSDVVNKAKMPTGGYSNVYQAGILSEIVTNVIDAALDAKGKQIYQGSTPPFSLEWPPERHPDREASRARGEHLVMHRYGCYQAEEDRVTTGPATILSFRSPNQGPVGRSGSARGSGPCDTPDQRDSLGRRCGNRAASVRAGGR